MNDCTFHIWYNEKSSQSNFVQTLVRVSGDFGIFECNSKNIPSTLWQLHLMCLTCTVKAWSPGCRHRSVKILII